MEQRCTLLPASHKIWYEMIKKVVYIHKLLKKKTKVNKALSIYTVNINGVFIYSSFFFENSHTFLQAAKKIQFFLIKVLKV